MISNKLDFRTTAEQQHYSAGNCLMAYVLKLCCPIRRSVCHARRLDDYAYSLPCGKIISGQRQCIVIPPYYFSNTRAANKIFDSRYAGRASKAWVSNGGACGSANQPRLAKNLSPKGIILSRNPRFSLKPYGFWISWAETWGIVDNR